MHSLPRLPFTALLLCATLSPCARAADPQTAHRFERTLTKTVGYGYLLSLPTGYEADPAKRWPLLVFLHGAGERGSDLWLVAKHGPPKLLRATTPPAPEESPEARARREAATKALAENFIVVSPQCPAGSRWDDDAVGALVDEITAHQRVDTRRVYLAGLSMGGYGSWSVGLKNPERFAAIVPICGGGSIVDILLVAPEKKPALLRLGVWAFHGALDPTVPLAQSETMITALKKAGVTDVKFTVYPGAKHDSWTETFNNPELYAWLLRHELVPDSRAAHPATKAGGQNILDRG